jgi:hypothetical protein
LLPAAVSVEFSDYPPIGAASSAERNAGPPVALRQVRAHDVELQNWRGVVASKRHHGQNQDGDEFLIAGPLAEEQLRRALTLSEGDAAVSARLPTRHSDYYRDQISY